MKNQLLLCCTFIGLVTASLAQVGINSDNSAPHPSAQLDIKSSDKGFLIPRLTTLERNAIQNPENALMVFDKDLQEIFIYNSDGWKQGTLSKLPLILSSGSFNNILKVTNTKMNSFPDGSTAAEFINNDILGIAISAKTSGNLPTIDARNSSGTAIYGESGGAGIAGYFSSSSGVSILTNTNDNHSISGLNNSSNYSTAKFVNNGFGRALELIGGANITSNNKINTLRVENNKPYNIGAIDDEAAGVFISNSPYGKGLISRTTNNGTAISTYAHGTGIGGYFYSENGLAVNGYSPNNVSILMSNNTLNYPTAKFQNLMGSGNALEVIGNVVIQGKILTDSYQYPNFENNWENYGFDTGNAKFYKDKENRVHLSGAVKNGTNTRIFTLPNSHRPANRLSFAVSTQTGFGKIDITNDGQVLISAGSFNQVSLDGISFRVE